MKLKQKNDLTFTFTSVIHCAFLLNVKYIKIKLSATLRSWPDSRFHGLLKAEMSIVTKSATMLKKSAFCESCNELIMHVNKKKKWCCFVSAVCVYAGCMFTCSSWADGGVWGWCLTPWPPSGDECHDETHPKAECPHCPTVTQPCIQEMLVNIHKWWRVCRYQWHWINPSRYITLNTIKYFGPFHWIILQHQTDVSTLLAILSLYKHMGMSLQL